MILVFVGAGGAAAVDKEQYPTTRRFFEKLPSEITANLLFGLVEKFLKPPQDGKDLDIEDIIGYLDALQADCNKFTSSSTMVGDYVVNKRAIPSDFSLQEIIKGSYSNLRQLEEETASLNDAIKRLVHDFYGMPPDRKKLSTWIKLFNGLYEVDADIEVFTTNYDLVLEAVCRNYPEMIEDGFSREGYSPQLKISKWELSPDNPSGGRLNLLTKLHGSVNWQYSDGDITISTPYHTGDHKHHCILYPGYKGTPTEHPFYTFHAHLHNVVQQKYGLLSAAIFVGFAFRDDAIWEILSGLPPDMPKYIIVKVDRENPEYAVDEKRTSMFKNMQFFGDGFADDVALLCPEHISRFTGRKRIVRSKSRPPA